MPFNLGLLSDAALTGLSDEEKNTLQKQATQQFLLGSLLSNDPSMGLKSAYSVPEQYISGQKAISDLQNTQRQRAEVAGFMEKYAPTQMQAGQRAMAGGGGPTNAAAQNQQAILNTPIDYQQALADSLRLAGNPAQPQIRETLGAMQPKFQGDLRVDASGRVVGALPTQKEGIQTQYNTATGQYSANPVQNYMMSQLMTQKPEVSANTMLGVTPQGTIQQMAIPGATQAVGAIEGAKAMAQAQGQVEQIVNPITQQKQFVSRSSLLGGGQGGGSTGTVGGAISELSPSQQAINKATSDRFNEYTKASLDSAMTAPDRRMSAEYLYNSAEQLDPNKFTEWLATGAAYARAIPGVGDKLDSYVGNVSLFNKDRSQ